MPIAFNTTKKPNATEHVPMARPRACANMQGSVRQDVYRHNPTGYISPNISANMFLLGRFSAHLLKYNGCQLATAVKTGTYPHTTTTAIIYHQAGLFTNQKDEKTENIVWLSSNFRVINETKNAKNCTKL